MNDTKNIIAISGKQYSGKDTVAELLLKYMPEYKRIGIGDEIKIKLAEQKGISLDEIYNNKHLYREELIRLGNWGRSISPDYWLNNLTGFSNIIVPDLRMVYEMEYFKSKGAILLRVEACFETRSKRGVIVSNQDATETSLDNYNKWDYIIENNSTYEYLDDKVQKLAEAILHRNY